MTIDATQDGLIIGVIGAGAMGRGIAQVAATGGCTVIMFDTRAESSKEAVEFIEGMLGRAVEKNRMTAEDAKASMGRIQIADSMNGLNTCHAIIEAATENLDIKRKIFAELESIVSDDIILATNTSSLIHMESFKLKDLNLILRFVRSFLSTESNLLIFFSRVLIFKKKSST